MGRMAKKVGRIGAKMKHYVYENWTAEDKAVIHRGSCGYCNDGKGCHENPLGDLNGKWHGPFDSLKEAERGAAGMGRAVKKCRCERGDILYSSCQEKNIFL